MKIGILTFQFADNYGALLQAYALKSYLTAQTQSSVEVINYANDSLQRAYSINPFQRGKMTHILKGILKYPLQKMQVAKFDAFRSERLQIMQPANICNHLRRDLDCYVVGSDQVWNEKITHCDKTYYLKDINGENVRRVSYAASADDRFLEDDCEEIIQLLKRFDAISVREKTVQNKLARVDVDSQLVLDPVFLLDRQQWKKISRRPPHIAPNYILYYSLQNNAPLDAIVKKLKQEMGLPVVVIHPTLRQVTKEGRCQWGIGPEEFVWLVENAQVVISNSFHAFAFSCIFSKKIYFDYYKGTTGRVSGLLELLQIPVSEDYGIKYAVPDIYQGNEYKQNLAVSKQFIEQYIL